MSTKPLDHNDIIRMTNIGTRFGDQWVHKNLNLSVKRGEILAIVGGSGSGKTTLLREMLALSKPTEGNIEILGENLFDVSFSKRANLEHRFGVLFQHNALFSSLTILENIMFPMQEHCTFEHSTMIELALLKLHFVGLPIETAHRFPSELSGGMQKRAALARALALDPELLFLDEPTAGLDPNNAAAFDQLLVKLQKAMGLSVVLVTHDLDTLWQITDRVAFLGERKVLAVDKISHLSNHEHELIKNFFHGPRGRVVQSTYLNHGTNDDGYKN